MDTLLKINKNDIINIILRTNCGLIKQKKRK